MSLKRELVIYADHGLVGTFCRFIEKTTEKGFVYLEFVPLNSFPPRKKILDKPIHKDHIHVLHSSSMLPGVEERIIMIFTNEPGSIVANVLKSDSEGIIQELREKIRKLQMQVASSKQSEEDARSGVNKAISSMKAVNRPTSSFVDGPSRYPQSGEYPPPSYGGGGPGGFEDF